MRWQRKFYLRPPRNRHGRCRQCLGRCGWSKKSERPGFLKACGLEGTRGPSECQVPVDKAVNCSYLGSYHCCMHAVRLDWAAGDGCWPGWLIALSIWSGQGTQTLLRSVRYRGRTNARRLSSGGSGLPNSSSGFKKPHQSWELMLEPRSKRSSSNFLTLKLNILLTSHVSLIHRSARNTN